MLNKKIIAPISLSLVLVLMTPSVMKASDLGDIVMSTSTSAGTWDDPLGGGTYVSGGDFKIKFKNTSIMAPLFDYRLPKVKTGCSGISLSGGFLSYLGLDKLQDQISDAGSSLIFGIILGIEFTLPAVGNVFHKIRAWANALTKMLQNACNIGKAIGGATEIAASFNNAMRHNAINDTFKEMNDWMKSGDPKLKQIEALGKCNGDPETDNCKLVTEALPGFAKKREEDKKNPSTNNANSIIGKKTKEIIGYTSAANEVVVTFSLKELYTDKEIKCTGMSGTSLTDEDVLIDKLKFVFFGDLGANYEEVKDLAAKIDTAPKCRLKVKAIEAEIGNTMLSGGKSSFPTPKFTPILPLITSPKDAAKALIYGFGKIEGNNAYVDGNVITIPNRVMVYEDYPTKKSADGKHSVSRTRSAFISGGDGDIEGGMELTWNGALSDSLKGIQKIVDKSTGHNWRLGSSYEEYDTSDVATTTSPLLLPGIKKYTSVIAKLERKAKAETPSTKLLKVKLAKINAILFSEALIVGIKTRVLESANGITGDSEQITKFIKSINDVEIEVKKILVQLREEVSQDQLVKEFKILEKEQNLESLKNGQF